MSEAKEYFKFGTRYPYIIGAANDTISDENSENIWEYGDNSFSNFDEVSDSIAEGGANIKFIPVNRIIKRLSKNIDAIGYFHKKRLYYPVIKIGKIPGSDEYTATSVSENILSSQEAASGSAMQFFEMIKDPTGNSYSKGDDITTEVKSVVNEIIENYQKSQVDLSELKKSGLSIVNDRNSNTRKNGEGKYLDLRVIYGMSVNEILSILSTNRKRKDLLFYKAQDWKEQISGLENIENLGFGVQKTDKIDSIAQNKIVNEIKLIPENFVFKSGFKYDLGLSSEVTNSGPFKMVNNLAGGAAMLDAIVKVAKKQEGAQSISFSERIDRFRNVPYVKDVDNNNIDSLAFKFNYGQFGRFSCYEEVVQPILKLASLFSYEFTDYENKKSGDSENYIKAPFEPKFNVMTKMYASLFQSGASMIRETLANEDENGKKQKPSFDTLANVPRTISKVVNNAAGQAKVTVFLFSIGSSIYGPFYTSDVRWEFDFERTDKNGLPFSGTINFSGIKPLIVEDIIGLLPTGGQIIGEKK